jgi:hypothetical protein
LARTRTILAIVLAVVIIIILAGATAYYLSLPPAGPGPSGTACSGTKAYSGTVTNATGVGVPGVVVQLGVAAPNSGVNTTATTGSDGAWSASVSGVCAYNLRYFWQSASAGPRLATHPAAGASSTQTVNVSWQIADLSLLAEFPHDANATVNVTLPQGLAFFVDANTTGSITTAFLPRDATGNPGYNFTVPGLTYLNGTAPFALVYPNATVYAVEDENGNHVTYAVPNAAFSGFSQENATDALNMTAAIANVLGAGGVPYVQVPGRSSSASAVNITNTTHALVGTVGTFFGSSLQDFITVRTNSTLFLRTDWTLTNPANQRACFVVDAEGPVVHAWFYGIGPCP